jgi:hypothetical protein
MANMRKVRGLLVVVAAVSIAACDMEGIRGSGHIVTEPRTVSGFTSVDLGGSGQLLIDQSGAESLTISADDNLLSYLTSDVRGGVLTLGTRAGTNISPTTRIVYKLSAKSLDGISVSGSGAVVATGVAAERLKVSVSGSGTLDVSGTAGKQDIRISGSGDYRAQNLSGKSATISISGSGDAVVNVSDKLDAGISGSGEVEYIGSPVVTQNISGAGRIRRR